MKTRLFTLLLLFMLGCSGGAPRSGGTAAPPPGPGLVNLRVNLELPQARGVNEVANVQVEVSDPNPPFNLVAGPVVTPVPEGATEVQTTLQVTPGRYRLSVFGYNEAGVLVAQSSPLVLDLALGQIVVQTISLLNIGPTPPIEIPIATSLQFAVQPPATVNAGESFSAQVAVLDQNGNLFTGFTGAVTLQGPDNLSVTAVPSGGVAIFDGLTIATPGTGFTLSASSTDLTAVSSDPFDVLAPTLTSIAITPNPVTLVGLAPQQLTATGTFSDNHTEVLTGVTWVSLNPAVATVDATTGVVTGTGSGGTATITASRDGVTGSVLATAGAGQLPRGNRAFPTSNQADYIEAMDANGDGLDDVLVGAPNAAQNGVFLFLTQPDGTLGAASLIFSDPTNGVNELVKGDFDALNGPDFALLQNDGVTFFLNDGAGGYTTNEILTPVGSNVFGSVGDIDGDGDLDLITNVGLNQLQIFVNNGAGTFALGAAVATGGGGDLTLDDFNGDGRADIALLFFPNVRIYLAGPGGTFAGFTSFLIDPVEGVLDIVSGNIDGVNGPDLVFVTNATGRVQSMLNSGTGTFAPPVTQFTLVGSFRVRLGDLDGDTIPDISLLNIFQNTVTALLNSGAAVFTAGTPASAAGGPGDIALGNIDGINGLDVVSSGASTVEPGVTVFLNQGGGTFFSNPTLGAGIGITQVVAADFVAGNGLDVAAVNSNLNRVELSQNLGSRTFQPFVSFAVGTTPLSLATADFNADGLPDIVTANAGGNDLSLLLNNGAGFNAAVTVNSGLANNPAFVTAGDFDGVNGPDLAVAQSLPGNVLILLNDGTGGFSAGVTQAVGAGPVGVQAADFTGDGFLDLAVANRDSNTVTILVNNGAGSFSTGTTVAVGNTPQGLAVGDFDGVNGPDFATSNAGSQDVSVVLNGGGGAFGAATSFAAPGAFRLAAGDIDQDGVLDQVTGSAGLAILLGQAGGAFSPETRYGSYASGQMAVADLDQDGHLDIALPFFGNASAPALIELVFGQ